LGSHAADPSPLENRREASFQVARWRDVVITTGIEQLAHHRDAIPPGSGQAVESRSQRATAHQPATPEVLEGALGTLGVGAPAQLEDHDVGPDDRHPVEHRGVAGL
jgi:hypothetical protein